MTITYRPVPGFHGYEAGSDGSVRSYLIMGNKREIGTIPRLLKPMLNNRTGYFTVHVRMPDGHRRKLEIHNLVLLAFQGAKPDGMEARHLDGNPTNNAADNLLWGTPRENQQDSIKHGTKSEQKEKVRKFSRDQILRIRELYSEGVTGIKIAEQFGCAFQSIYRILNRKRYADVE